jgi:hypothetical protein
MIKLIKTKNNECFYLLTLSFYIDFAISILNRNIWCFVGAAIVKTGIECTDNKGNNKITELRTILQRESQNS